MAQTETRHTTPTPFLAQYASERTPFPEIQGYYSPETAMWVVNAGGFEIPLIDHAKEAVELVTKTMIVRETDDEENSFSSAELATKTRTQSEQDDASAYASLEMATKTEAQLEHDDTSPEVTGVFL